MSKELKDNKEWIELRTTLRFVEEKICHIMEHDGWMMKKDLGKQVKDLLFDRWMPPPTISTASGKGTDVPNASEKPSVEIEFPNKNKGVSRYGTPLLYFCISKRNR